VAGGNGPSARPGGVIVCLVPGTRLVILRHAIAVPRGTDGVSDENRPLTSRGRKRFRQAARGLARIVRRPDLLLTSPLPRALETATIAARVWGRLTPIPEPLLLGGHPEAILAGLAAHGRDGVVAIVGHEPDVSGLLAHLVGGRGERVPFRKGGAALVELDEREPGSGRLIWFLPPRLLRRLGRD